MPACAGSAHHPRRQAEPHNSGAHPTALAQKAIGYDSTSLHVSLPENHGRWRSYAACFRGHRLALLLLTLAGLLQSFSWLPGAAILRRVFDQLLPAEGTSRTLSPGDLNLFWLSAAELMGLQLAALLLAWWIRTTASRVNQDVLSLLRTRAIAHFYRLPRAFHTQADVEKLHLTMVHETGMIESMNTAVVTQLLPGIFGALVLFWILARIEPVYAAVLAVVAPACFLLNRAAQRDAWLRQESLRVAWGAFSRGVRFMVQALDLTRSHAAEKFEIARQTDNVRNLRDISLGLYRFDARQQVLQGFLLLTCTLGALLAGGWLVATGHATRGQVMVFYAAAGVFAMQARAIVDSIPPVRRGLSAFDELNGLMRTTEREPFHGTRIVEHIDNIRMDDVCFSYREGVPLLSGVSFEIRRGEQIALIGANGSGKSTIAHLIMGVYRPDSGGISVSGTNYDEADIRALRTRMAILPQNPFLFPGTIRDNLTYGLAVCSDHDVWQALEWSGAGAFVGEIADGLNSAIGEQGILLSGGQRQKLALARALLRKPEFLIFDEPTNHLDEEAIAILLHNLARLPFNPAVLIISHDPIAQRHASRAWRLEDGSLREVIAGAGAAKAR
jgi:ATP-binding cassette, subfamily B, bacterial